MIHHQRSLTASAPMRGGGLAVIAGSTAWSYADLEARVSRRVTDLRSQGLSAGQVVLVRESPALDLLVMQQALLRLGCGLLPMPVHRAQGEVERLMESASVEWLWQSRTGQDGRLEPSRLSGRVATSAAPVALLMETSGSQGGPRGVMLTPDNLRASSDLVNARLGLGPGDVWLCCLPRSHVGGLMIGDRCVRAGATIVLHEAFDTAVVAGDLERRRVTHLSLVPPMLARLLSATEGPPATLRVLLVGGQALSSTLAREAIDAGWPLHVTYGMTETASQVATSCRLLAPPTSGVIGPPLPGIGLRCEGSPERPRRIRIRGRVVMAGYANPPRLPGLGLEDGWLVTSDLGYLTRDGALAVLGRADDVLVIGGESVHPARVEERISAAPGLESAVVLGIPDHVWGYRLAVAYTGRIRPEELDRWCRNSLPGRFRPRELHQVEQLPTLASGKLDRRRIVQMLAEPENGQGR
jgi:O-succinylbenzoic acid--CoA ligase